MLRPLTATAVLIFTLAACSGGSTGSTGSTGARSEPPAHPSSPGTPTVSPAEVIRRAEAAVKGSLPDAPIWEGMTFAGSVVNDSTVCVDRTWGPGGDIDGKPGSAGYVLVTFPGETLGEPTEGVCADVAGVPEPEPTPPVVVPDSVKGAPGLVTRTDLGEDWPLTVDYGVLGCQSKVAGGRVLQMATFTGPDGTVYALNGTAKSHTDAQAIDPIWAPDPDLEGLKIGIGPLIDRALALC